MKSYIQPSIFTIFFMFIFASQMMGQGCSDAGFCTINGFKPNSADSLQLLKNQFKTGAFVGSADNSISVYGNYFEYNRQWNEKVGLDIKITTLAQSGNGISTFGLSDAFVNFNYKANDKLKFIVGTKIPLTNANKKEDGVSLPMDYQASLGTFDLILGWGLQLQNWQFVAAIQQPLTQNENQFFASNFSADSELNKFQSTNNYKRSGDVLVRVSYPITVNSKFRFTPSLLPIYHLKNDEFTNELNQTLEIEGSQGLTFNGNIYLDYDINTKSTLQFNFGMPFAVRESRPDGLTRGFVANLEYRFKF